MHRALQNGKGSNFNSPLHQHSQHTSKHLLWFGGEGWVGRRGGERAVVFHQPHAGCWSSTFIEKLGSYLELVI